MWRTSARTDNGDPDSTGRAGILSIELNGVEIVTGAFDESVALVDLPVSFAATNTLQIMVAGAPGAHVAVSALAAISEEFAVYGPVVFTRHAAHRTP
jgi:hypothetical protein